ncbi:MAG: gamma-glutamyl-gamma-aminobutyrate hydrolase family protein [bacterium]
MLEKNGLRIAGINEERNLVEIVEVKNHPFMVGVQFHPEFKSRPLNPHPLVREFIKVSIQ